MNAPVMVELEGETDPLKIAMKELKLVMVFMCMIRIRSICFGRCVLEWGHLVALAAQLWHYGLRAKTKLII